MTEFDASSAATPGGGGQPPRRGRRLADAALAFTARAMGQVATLLVTLLAARFLAPAEYGLYTLAIVFVLLLQAMTYAGVYQYIVVAKGPDEPLLSTTFWMIAGIAVAGAAVLALGAAPLAWAFDAPELGPILLWLAVVQPLTAVAAWTSALLMRRESMRLFFLILLVENVIFLAAGVALTWAWRSVYALVAVQYVRVVLSALIYGAMAPRWPRLAFDRALARQALGFSGGLYGARALSVLTQYGADLLLGLAYSTAEAGLYRFGNRLATGATDVVVQPMRSMALARFGAAGREDQDLGPLLARFAGTTLLLVGGTAATIAVLARDVVTLLFDPAYLAALAVTYALALRAVAGVGMLLMDAALTARGRTGMVMRFSTVLALASLAAVLATSSLGLGAVAWAQAAVALAASLAALWTLGQVGGLPLGGALRASGTALALVAGFTAALILARAVLGGSIDDEATALAATLMAAVLLGALTLLIGRRLGSFHLHILSR